MEGVFLLIALVVIIGLLVFVHELGHFMAAKLAGVVVEEFALGFGPALISRKFKGTLYKVNALPLGGYVKLQGERGETAEEKLPGSYSHKPLRSKLFILVAGVTMNIIFACVLFVAYLPAVNYEVSMRKEGAFSFVGAEKVSEVPPSLFVLQIEPGSPAEGQIRVGDAIVTLNGVKVESEAQFREYLSERAGETLRIQLLSTADLQTREVDVQLREANSENKPLLGVGAAYDKHSYFVVKYPAHALSAFAHGYNMFFYQITALGSLIGQSIAKSDVTPVLMEVGGLIAVAGVVNDLISIRDFLSLLNLTAVVSLSLAFANLLPIPLLDGGQMVIETIEKVRRRRLSDRTLGILNMVGLVILLGLFVVITLKDIVQVGIIADLISGIRGVLGR